MNKKKTELPNNGERLVPEFHKGSLIYGEHIARYRIAEGLVKNDIVLDIASGSGYGTRMMSDVAKWVDGVDVSADAVLYAKDNFSAKNIKFTEGSAISIPFDDGRFDTVVSFETLEHISEDQNIFIKEIKRVLKKNGKLIISTPNDKVVPPGNHFHVHELNIAQFKHLLLRHFKYVDIYFQSVALTSFISEHRFFNSEQTKNINVEKIYNIPEKDNTFFVAICSDVKQPSISPYAVLSENWMHIDKKNQFDYIKKLEYDNAKLSDINKELIAQVDKMNKGIIGILKKIKGLFRS